MRGKYIAPTRTCRVCSLLRFDGKKWCFSRLSDQFKPIAVPRPVVLSTGSNALRPYRLGRRMQRDLHFRLDRYRDASLHCSEDLPLNCCSCSAAGRAQSGFEGNLIRQRHSRRFCLETCSCRLTMEPLRGECQALRPRPEREVCNPQIHLLHLPHHLSRLEARKTDNDNAKQQKKKIEDNSNCSQPLACAQASHPFVQTGGGKAGSALTQMEPSLSSIKQAPFFHCTIARLAAAHTFLMAEISRHALTDLRRQSSLLRMAVLNKKYDVPQLNPKSSFCHN